MSKTKFDLIVFGATSFVGEIVCQRLLKTIDPNTSWAIAGRSESKLNTLKKNLGSAAKDIPIIVADASDAPKLIDMCNQTRVIISTVGPYALYGEPLIKACVETGTDYCDLTGEAQWIRLMIERYEASAIKSGARIVHSCGFDSIPSDLGVHFLQEHSKQTLGSTCPQIQMRVKTLKGGASGGTIASMLNIFKEARSNPELRRELQNPYSLCPDSAGFSARQVSNVSEFNEALNSWAAPFVMAAINTRVVHRSNALLKNDYGNEFTYDEGMLTGKGLKGRARATTLTAGLAGFALSASFSPSRWLLEKALPKVGEGPSPEEQKNGCYDLRFIGTSSNGEQLQARVTGDRDPGYGSTAKMLSQAGLCLAHDLSKSEYPGGFWTPASLMAKPLTARLIDNAGLTFEIVKR
jgi:short subunit dehydrogenase-like uncharacterized protein